MGSAIFVNYLCILLACKINLNISLVHIGSCACSFMLKMGGHDIWQVDILELIVGEAIDLEYDVSGLDKKFRLS